MDRREFLWTGGAALAQPLVKSGPAIARKAGGSGDTEIK